MSPDDRPTHDAATDVRGAAGRRILVTGGSSGLGAAIVQAARRVGDRVAVLDVHQPSIADAYVEVDLAQPRAAERAAAQAVDELGGLDAVVTSAGIDRCGPLGDVESAEWERVIAVNLLGTAAVVRAVLPALRAAHGRIVTVASTLGLRAVSDATAYCASKFGVVGFTRALAAELAGQVGVTLLIPGGMQTAFFDDRPEQYKPGADAKLNDPRNVAAAVLHVLAQPPGCEVRELVVAGSLETSWP